MKISKDLSAKYYQENNWLPRKAREIYQNLSKEEREKMQQDGCERYKISRKMKNQNLAEYRNNYYRLGKMLYYNYKKTIILRNNDLESSFDEKHKDALKL